MHTCSGTPDYPFKVPKRSRHTTCTTITACTVVRGRLKIKVSLHAFNWEFIGQLCDFHPLHYNFLSNHYIPCNVVAHPKHSTSRSTGLGMGDMAIFAGTFFKLGDTFMERMSEVGETRVQIGRE